MISTLSVVMAASNMCQGGGALAAAFRPPPGLTNDDHLDFLAPPPGLEFPLAATRQANASHQVPTSIQRTPQVPAGIHTLSLLAAIGAVDSSSPVPLKVYPSKPPGVFQQPRDAYSSASTTASDDNDELPGTSTRSHSPEAPKQMGKGFLRDLQVEPLDITRARPLKVHWPVDSRKLHCRDKQVVSPSFEVLPGCSFKLMLKPKIMGDKKYQEGFQRARGYGSVELKCVEGTSLAPTLRFWISVGDGSARGPIMHDFSESTVSGLTKNEANFDFASAVDRASSMFSVFLEAYPVDSLAPAQD